MAPARSSGRRAQRTQNSRKQQQHDGQDAQQKQPSTPQASTTLQTVIDTQSPPVEQQGEAQKLFLDPMSAQPLQMYIEKDVEDRDKIADAVQVSVELHGVTAFDACKCLVGI